MNKRLKIIENSVLMNSSDLQAGLLELKKITGHWTNEFENSLAIDKISLAQFLNAKQLMKLKKNVNHCLIYDGIKGLMSWKSLTAIIWHQHITFIF